MRAWADTTIWRLRFPSLAVLGLPTKRPLLYLRVGVREFSTSSKLQSIGGFPEELIYLAWVATLPRTKWEGAMRWLATAIFAVALQSPAYAADTSCWGGSVDLSPNLTCVKLRVELLCSGSLQVA
jgi:hypothetical protein